MGTGRPGRAVGACPPEPDARPAVVRSTLDWEREQFFFVICRSLMFASYAVGPDRPSARPCSASHDMTSPRLK